MKTRPEADFSSPLCQPYEVRQGEHGVLLMHGFAGSAAHMRRSRKDLCSRALVCAPSTCPVTRQRWRTCAAVRGRIG